MSWTQDDVDLVIEMAVKVERERCAVIAESYAYTWNENKYQPFAMEFNFKARVQAENAAMRIREGRGLTEEKTPIESDEMGTKKEKPLKGYGVRADESKMRLATNLGLDIGELFRQTLDRAIMEAKKQACPICGKKRS